MSLTVWASQLYALLDTLCVSAVWPSPVLRGGQRPGCALCSLGVGSCPYWTSSALRSALHGLSTVAACCICMKQNSHAPRVSSVTVTGRWRPRRR